MFVVYKLMQVKVLINSRATMYLKCIKLKYILWKRNLSYELKVCLFPLNRVPFDAIIYKNINEISHPPL